MYRQVPMEGRAGGKGRAGRQAGQNVGHSGQCSYSIQEKERNERELGWEEGTVRGNTPPAPGQGWAKPRCGQDPALGAQGQGVDVLTVEERVHRSLITL